MKLLSKRYIETLRVNNGGSRTFKDIDLGWEVGDIIELTKKYKSYYVKNLECISDKMDRLYRLENQIFIQILSLWNLNKVYRDEIMDIGFKILTYEGISITNDGYYRNNTVFYTSSSQIFDYIGDQQMIERNKSRVWEAKQEWRKKAIQCGLGGLIGG